MAAAVFALPFLTGFSFFSPTWEDVNSRIDKEFVDVEHITIDQLLDKSAERAAVLIDVRSPEEFRVSSLDGAVNILKPADVSIDPANEIIVFCSVGYRSAHFARKLKKRGYSRVYNLRGSLFEWANRGLPLYQGDIQTNVVHPFNSRWGSLLDKRFHSYEPIHPMDD